MRQGLILTLLVYVTWTTLHADMPVEAWVKWDWVWKALIFAVFLPFTLRTKLQDRGLLPVPRAVARRRSSSSAASRRLAGGAGYGVLNLMVDNNSGLYESSTISTVAIALDPADPLVRPIRHDLPARLAGEDLLLAP